VPRRHCAADVRHIRKRHAFAAGIGGRVGAIVVMAILVVAVFRVAVWLHGGKGGQDL
jgi:hypothetical protein